MARQSREQVIEELTKMNVNFDARESYDNLCELLKIENRNAKSSPQQGPAEQQGPVEPSGMEQLPLTSTERNRLKELEQMANMGRAMDQPTPAEMHELGRLRARANVANKDE